MKKLVCFAAVIALAGFVFAGEPHPFTVHDLHAMDRLSGLSVSPDGNTVLFTVRSTDFDKDGGTTDLWTVPASGGEPRRLTTDPAADHSGAWTPDGTAVLFLSSRSGSSQLWKIRMDGGEARQVTDLPAGINGFLQSPSGDRLVLALEVFPDCDTVQCTVDRLDARAAGKVSGRIHDSLFVRHWDTWKDGRRSHLFLMPAGGGDLLDLMKGMNADSPSKPFGGMEEVTFTRDGTGVVFTARQGKGEAWSTDLDLYLVPADGSARPEVLTPDNDAVDTTPVFSPDGGTLAWLAMERPGFEADRLRIMLRSWPDGETKVLADDWDRSVSSLFWAPDGKSIYATAPDLGNVSLFSISIPRGKVKRLVTGGKVQSAERSGDRLVYGLETLRSPVELFTADLKGKDVRSLTRINEDRLNSVLMGEYEQFSFKGWNDENVYGYVIKPVGVMEGRKFPVAFIIHGGPQGSSANGFHYRWNPQPYAAAGYGVVMIDFHGSTGYGQQFTDSISRDWGGKPLVDLQKGLEAALERYDFLDGNRVAALGASYGGYMVNWIAGNWPDRFRCLVNHDGVFDTRAMYFETEELWFDEWEQGGTPWENPKGYEEFNPVAHIGNWKTPMLVIHGGLDYRVPDTQGIGAFNALQRRGIPSRFLYFPDENHFVLRPSNAALWHETVLGWMDRWTKPMP
ncbi:MAG: S9 family peptidase [Acidobacteria bacterium]|uniref:S9 family peptidase n=1 Tax=Candidatus Polarisedimenticola svalbardensis TaxID=2886004 RepID=A0A8J7CDL9_9BACT|nr:S9 family peptidase [Candidatus Polarisedimenticola svalbardensis]